MKRIALILLALGNFTIGRALAVDQPRGSVLELHSCELYAGGCVVSSEATLGGRYMLQAWNFTGGSIDGTSVAGLQLAALHSGSQNLAEQKSAAGEVVVYLPEKATKAQRAALVSWLKNTQAGFKSPRFQTRLAPMQFSRDEAGYSFTAGKFLNVKTASLES
jgi:hypothetical protein